MSTVAGIGVDIVDIAQMRSLLDGGSSTAFIEKTFSRGEIDHAEGDAERFASLFAAKEAAFKAFRTGWIDGQCVETTHEKDGAPVLRLHGQLGTLAQEQGIAELWLSVSATEHCAVAMVVVSR